MKYQRIIGITVVVVGIVLLGLSSYIKSEVAKELGGVHRKTEALSNNPLTQAGGSTTQKSAGFLSKKINKAADKEAAPYHTLASWLLFGGIALIVVGGAVTIFSCTHCSRKK